jgi:type II secretory pathway pseudopilin PulG
MKKSKTLRKKAAFTLAETLIAIGIIGVVAALTIPTLMRKYEKSVIEKNLAKTYAEISNIVRQSEADNGSFEGWDFTLHADDFLDIYIKPYIQLYTCKTRARGNYCFDKNLGNWKYGPNETETPYTYLKPYSYYTKDGRFFSIVRMYDSSHDIRYVWFFVDVNGRTGKSIMGQDVFVITLMSTKPSIPLQFTIGPTWVTSEWGEVYIKEHCSSNTTDGASMCGELLRRNNWKFPKDYPLKF